MTGNSDTGEAVPQAEAEPRHIVRTVFLVLLVVSVLGAAGVALGLVDQANAKSRVPAIAGMSANAASKALSAARLEDGRASYSVTRDFPAGRILAETPAAGTMVAQGTPVDVQIATAPQQVTVPDLVLAQAATAESTVSQMLLRPSLRYSYNKTVETGLVIEQLPRAGDTAPTGSACVLVISLGPGTGGEVVPDVVRMLLGPARSELTSQTLFAEARTVEATGVADGVVVDQAPSAGSIVPATSIVTVSVAISDTVHF